MGFVKMSVTMSFVVVLIHSCIVLTNYIINKIVAYLDFLTFRELSSFISICPFYSTTVFVSENRRNHGQHLSHELPVHNVW